MSRTKQMARIMERADREMEARVMAEVRAYAAKHRKRINDEWDALPAPPLTAEEHRTHAQRIRREGQKIWGDRFNSEWEQ